MSATTATAGFIDAGPREAAERRHEAAVAMGDVVLLSPCCGGAALDTSDPEVRRLALVAGIGSGLLALGGVVLTLFVG